MSLIVRKPSQQLVDIVGALGGTWHGYSAMCRCPAHADVDPSLSLRQGDRGILVTCFAGCDREDVLRELRRLRPGEHFPAPPAVGSSKTANVERLWNEAAPVERSLGARYLELRGLPADLPDVRFHPRCPHGPRPLTKFKPAMLIALREGRHLMALQRIFIDPESARYTEKAMLGTPASSAWQGGRPERTLAIAEGFETSAAFTELHGIPCWASLGARRLDLLALPESVRTVIIAEDNDGEGRRAARKAWARYRRDGRMLRRMPPPRGVKDWAKANEIRRERGGGSRG